MNRTLTTLLFVLAIALGAVTVPVAAQGRDFENVEIETVRVAPGVYMLIGAGGNIGLSVGEDGVFMIDDQFAPLTDRILAAERKVTDQPVRFVINTHWHGDHTGGNENLDRAGAIIIAHENVRRRLSTDQFMKEFNRSVPARPEEALPVVTFTDTITFYWNGDELHVFHVENAHTDGDAIIHFRRANVVHMGDTFFSGTYPFIDVSADGSIDGVIEAADRVLAFANERTRIIPGHGPLSGVSELRDYRDMLATVRDRIRPMVAAGKSRREVVESKPTRDFDEAWGGGFMKPDRWVGVVYDGMVNR